MKSRPHRRQVHAVEDVADDGHPVLFAEEANVAGRMSRRVEDPKAGQFVTFLQDPGDGICWPREKARGQPNLEIVRLHRSTAFHRRHVGLVAGHGNAVALADRGAAP